MMGCLSDETTLAFVRGKLGAEDAREVDLHLGNCGDCRRVVADALAFFAKDAEPSLAPPGGTMVGRYQCGEVMGAGGAGVVYRAYDPQLGRPVALKLLWSPGPDAGASRQRILREARAMAQLAHPNVVNVYDAGVYESYVYIVMELVEGPTLRAWLRQRRRSQREIVDAFIAAGRGLAAAHAAGLVHRDFKPDNVLVCQDGKAKLTDFGLAVDGERPREVGSGGRAPLTGTPPYMAPEQFLGKPVDARGDQFGFCVALYEALFEQAPFRDGSREGNVLRDAVRDVLSGALRPMPQGHSVPRWLYDVLAQGLQKDPASRYASMDDLLESIERGYARHVTRNRLVYLAVVAGVVVLAAGTLWWRIGGRSVSRSNIVVAAMVCGNGVVEAGEECDDGNLHNTDACTSQCQVCSGGGAHFTALESGHCYTRHDGAAGWEGAFVTCRKSGAYLASIDSLTEALALQAHLALRPGNWYWVGLHDSMGTRNYQWETGASVLPYATWLSRTSPAKGGCVSFGDLDRSVASAGNGTALKLGNLGDLLARDVLAAFPCTQALGFICEKTGWLTREETGHTYRGFYRERTWDGARRLCESLGAHLATVTDARENAFVGSAFPGTFWLGGARKSAGEDFVWVNREKFSHGLFGDDDPNSVVFPACVVRAADGTLRDRPCDGSDMGPYGALCEME